MTRSIRHAPIAGNLKAKSDKPGKTTDSRRLRRRVSQTLAQTQDGDAVPHDHEIRNPRLWPKDGKGYYGRMDGSDLARIIRK